MNALADKVAIVTGASSGIGHATALLFAREGAAVVVSARRQVELDALVARIESFGDRPGAAARDLAGREGHPCERDPSRRHRYGPRASPTRPAPRRT